ARPAAAASAAAAATSSPATTRDDPSIAPATAARRAVAAAAERPFATVLAAGFAEALALAVGAFLDAAALALAAEPAFVSPAFARGRFPGGTGWVRARGGPLRGRRGRRLVRSLAPGPRLRWHDPPPPSAPPRSPRTCGIGRLARTQSRGSHGPARRPAEPPPL